jgi:hypothetical protein
LEVEVVELEPDLLLILDLKEHLRILEFLLLRLVVVEVVLIILHNQEDQEDLVVEVGLVQEHHLQDPELLDKVTPEEQV